MTITEAINLAKNYSREAGIETAEASRLWPDGIPSRLDESQFCKKTYNSIKLIETLVKRDVAKEWLDPDNMTLDFSVEVGTKTKKAIPYNLWFNIRDTEGNLLFSMAYTDFHNDGRSVVKDGNGTIIFIEKGWKELREKFTTGKKVKVAKPKPEVVEVEAEPEDTPSPEIKAALDKVAPKSAEEDADYTEECIEEEKVASTESDGDWIIPDIPEELQ